MEIILLNGPDDDGETDISIYGAGKSMIKERNDEA